MLVLQGLVVTTEPFSPERTFPIATLKRQKAAVPFRTAASSGRTGLENALGRGVFPKEPRP
jgi:hypothetical protein